MDSISVLIVEDSSLTQNMLARTIRACETDSFKIEITQVKSAETALPLIQEIDYNLILLDHYMNMPGMTGLDLINQLKMEHDKHIGNILFVTAHSDEILPMIEYLGIRGCINKSEIIESIGQIIADFQN